MKGKVLSFGAAVSIAAVASAVTVDKNWSIVIPDRDDTGVSRAIREAVSELAEAFEEGVGLKLPVVERSKFKGGPALHIGEASAKAAGCRFSGT